MTARIGSFTAYVEAAQAAKSGQTAQVGVPETWEASLKLLTVVASSDDRSLIHLQALSGLDFSTFARLFEGLKTLGLVMVTGEPGTEQVELTSAGRRMLALSGLEAGA